MPACQNYTCSGGVYGTNMAVATLFDASCCAFISQAITFRDLADFRLCAQTAVGTPLYSKLPEMSLSVAPKAATLPAAVTTLIGQTKLGDHYFQKLSPTATSANPVFDLRCVS